MDVEEDGPGTQDLRERSSYGELSREAENTEQRKDKNKRGSQTTERKLIKRNYRGDTENEINKISLMQYLAENMWTSPLINRFGWTP